MPKESLSALLDGECSDAEIDRLLEEMDRAPQLAQQWGRFWLRHESAVEGTRVLKGQACICADVMAAIAAEPAPSKVGKVVDLAAWRLPSVKTYLRPVAGFAAAASMGAAAVLFIGGSEEPRFSSGRTVLLPDSSLSKAADRAWRPAPTPTVGGPASSAMLQPVQVAADDLGDWSASNAEYAAQLREYLVDHSSAAAQGLGSTLRYARFAAYNSDARLDVRLADEQP